MENYTKGAVIEPEEKLPFSDSLISSDFVHMKVKHGTKLQNVLEYTLQKLTETDCVHVVISGAGKAVTKVVTCAEIVKRRLNNVHQVTRIASKKIEEMWEPKKPSFDRLIVSREVPAIHILLSKNPIDPSELGYQAPGSSDAFWKSACEKERTSNTRRPYNSAPYLGSGIGNVDRRTQRGRGSSYQRGTREFRRRGRGQPQS